MVQTVEGLQASGIAEVQKDQKKKKNQLRRVSLIIPFPPHLSKDIWSVTYS